MAEGFDIRFEKYDEIHENTWEDWKVFMDALKLEDNQRILDGAGGYGEVTSHIKDRLYKYVPSKDNSISNTKRPLENVDIQIIDNSSKQLERLCDYRGEWLIPKYNIHLCDIRDIKFPDNYFDSYIMKMGVHETPKRDHLKIFKEAYRVLKPGGKFIMWELALNELNQKIFQKIIRKKDELSGFASMSKLRYFPRHFENMQNYYVAGFVNVNDIHTKMYHPKPSLRGHEIVSDLRAVLLAEHDELSKKHRQILSSESSKRVSSLCDYVRETIPVHLQEFMDYKDLGNDVTFKVEKKIYVGYKPE